MAWAGGSLVLYFLLVAWLTWPLAANLGSTLPNTTLACLFDGLFGPWVLGWESHALATAPGMLIDANIYYPAKGALFYGQTGFAALPLFAPTFLVTGNPTLAVNVTFLGGVALTAWGLHCVVRQWTESHLAGFVAAWTFLSTRWVLWTWIPAVQYIAALYGFPWLILLGARGSRRLREGLATGLLTSLQSLACLVYVAPAAMLPLGVLALKRLANRDHRSAGLRLAVGLALGFLLLTPFYWEYYRVRADNPGLSTQSPWAPRDIPELRPFRIANHIVAPLRLPWWNGGNPGPLGVPHAAVMLILVGAAAARVRHSAVGQERWRLAWRHGLLWTTVGVLISTPTVALFGSPPIRLPLTVLLEPFLGSILNVIRDPGRLAVAALFGLAVLAGVGFIECSTALAGRLRSDTGKRMAPLVLLCLFLVVAHAEVRRIEPATYPVQPTPQIDTPALREASRGRGPLLELPLEANPLTQVIRHSGAMFRSLFHWRPLLNGNNSFWPAGFAERMTLARRLPDAGALAALRRDTGLTSVLVQRTAGSAQAQRWIDLAQHGDRNDLRLVAEDDQWLLFDVLEPDQPRIETQAPSAQPSR